MFIIKLMTDYTTFKCDTFTDAFKMCDKLDEPAIISGDDGVVLAFRNYKMDTELEIADFSVRTYNCLKRAGCNTIGDVLHMYGLPHVRNLGRKSMNEIRRFAQYIREPLWCDAQTLIDLALIGLEKLADKTDIDIDNNDTYCDLCERITTASLEGWPPDLNLAAEDIASIKEELGL